jgi:hypothetical protein
MDELERAGRALRDSIAGEPEPSARVRTRARVIVRNRRVVAVAAVASAVIATSVGIGLAARGSTDIGIHTIVPAGSSSTGLTTVPLTSSPGTANQHIDPAAIAALNAWSSFPVTADPRPLVLLEGAVNAPEYGFTDPSIRVADAQNEAFDAGAITTPTSLPSGPTRADGYPIISAAAAIENLRSAGTGTATSVLTTTGVALGASSFLTDRGYVELPAWLVSFNGVKNPAAVLAVAPASLFAPPDQSVAPSQIGAIPTRDPRTVILTFAGAAAGTGPCSANYTARFAESTTAIAVNIEATGEPTATRSSIACAAIAYSRQITITLTSPLGARVLVDEKTTSAIAVSR